MKGYEREIAAVARWGMAIKPPFIMGDPRIKLPVVEELQMPAPAGESYLRDVIQLVEHEGLWSYAPSLMTRHHGGSSPPSVLCCAPHVSRADALRAAGRFVEGWVDSWRGCCPVNKDPDRCGCPDRLLKWVRGLALTGPCACCGYEGPEKGRACQAEPYTTCRRCKNGCGALRASRQQEETMTETQIPAPPAPVNGKQEDREAHRRSMDAALQRDAEPEGKKANVGPFGAADQALVDEAGYWASRWAEMMRDAVAAMLETGRRLITLKERLPHGQFLAAQEHIGVTGTGAKRAMRAACNLLQDGRPREVVADLDSVSKAYALSDLTADDLELLEQGGQVGGVDVADINSMPVREVVRAFRAQRDAERARHDEEIQDWQGRYDATLDRVRDADSGAFEAREKLNEHLREGSAVGDPIGRNTPVMAARFERAIRELEMACDYSLSAVEDLYGDGPGRFVKAEVAEELRERMVAASDALAEAADGLRTRCTIPLPAAGDDA